MQRLKLAKELISALYCFISFMHLNGGGIRLHNFGSFKQPIHSSQQHYFNLTQYLDSQKKFYRRSKKSSLGILFWEISSGTIPFENKYIEAVGDLNLKRPDIEQV
ncbi:1262_t:CDS:2 [Entrophospora sp. SA101]|nr:8524_t:CDS:2 [Entrophospora sp. SA101]CAJ0864525.1 1262_t:CDS:2 [Entrophospora sp. SA101]